MNEEREARLGGRWPDFLIVGAMKAGTTTLFDWLGHHEDVWLPREKEPNYFSSETRWLEGDKGYLAMFEGISAEQLTGEASTSYSNPTGSADIAKRINSTLPTARIVFLVRDPIERARSHYVHEVLRGREHRTFLESIADGHSPYLAWSRYVEAFGPYVNAFSSDQLCVLTFEDLFALNDDRAWRQVLSFLDLRHIERPTTHLNASEGRPQFSRGMSWLWLHGLKYPPRRSPGWLRALGRRALIRESSNPLVGTALAKVPESVEDALRQDAERLGEMLGRPFGYRIRDDHKGGE